MLLWHFDTPILTERKEREREKEGERERERVSKHVHVCVYSGSRFLVCTSPYTCGWLCVWCVRARLRTCQCDVWQTDSRPRWDWVTLPLFLMSPFKGSQLPLKLLQADDAGLKVSSPETKTRSLDVFDLSVNLVKSLYFYSSIQCQ